jgi:hypothetical protein
MTPDGIARSRNLIHQVNNNAYKRRTGLPSQREEANGADMDLVSKLCDALEEALDALESK